MQSLRPIGASENLADFQGPEWDLSALAQVRPQTSRELYEWIRTHCRTEVGQPVRLAHTAVCRGHDAPFSFIRDAFFKKHNRQLVKAPRTGGKTFDFALIAFLETWFEGLLGESGIPLEYLDIGAIHQQALACYDYSSSIYKQKEFYPHIDSAGILKESIVLPDGSQIRTVVATLKGVNSPHCPRVNIDELDLWDPYILQQALSIALTKGPHRAAVRMGSTQKFALGPMQTLLEEAEARGYKTYQWCCFETLEKCPPERDCKSCPLYEWPDDKGGLLCAGRAKHSTGYFLIDDLIDRVMELDRKTFEEEWLCLRPSREGVVFGDEYRETVHRHRGEIPYSSKLPLRISIDQGFTNPFAVLFFQEDVKFEQTRIIGEMYETGKTGDVIGRQAAQVLHSWGVPDTILINGIHEQTNLDVVFDAEDPAAARLFIRGLAEGARNLSPARTYTGRLRRVRSDVLAGISLCRQALKYLPGRPAKTIISSGLRWLPWELTQYRYPTKKGADRPTSEKPIDKDNHLIDSWRRYLLWKRKKQGASMGADIRR